MDFSQLMELLELGSYITVILGVPVGLHQYMQAKRREREEQERRVFDAVSASYVEFQQLCLERPYLEVFDIPDEHPVTLTPAQAKEELIAFAVLFSIFERAYLLYADRPTPIMDAQRREWDTHIREYFRRPNFRRAWSLGASSYDPRFVSYMSDIEQRVSPAHPTSGSTPLSSPPSAPTDDAE